MRPTHFENLAGLGRDNIPSRDISLASVGRISDSVTCAELVEVCDMADDSAPHPPAYFVGWAKRPFGKLRTPLFVLPTIMLQRIGGQRKDVAHPTRLPGYPAWSSNLGGGFIA